MQSRVRRSFGSDNNAPVAPEILQAIIDANAGDAVAYGEDAWTARAIDRFREQFGEGTDVYFTLSGTGANVAALSSLLRPWEAVLAPATAHLQTDECGALERFSGSKVIPIATRDGKLRPADIAPRLLFGEDAHFPQPRIVSIAQATELGGVYEIEELRELTAFAHDRGLLVHMDGARIANAAVALDVALRATTVDAGIDVLTFGGTKNGLMLGEAICFFDAGLHQRAAPYVRMQAMQLASKMRYVAAQFEALLSENLWSRYARHSNTMAARLYERVRRIDGVRITRPVRCNAVFATLDRAAIERIQREFFFFVFVFDEPLPEARWMTHWATTEQDVDEFADCVAAALRNPARR
jgi:threonine aldolase